MYTKRVLFCIGPVVNFDFFYIPPPLGNLRCRRRNYPLREIHGKYRISMDQKLALITNGLSGYPTTRPDCDLIKKKAALMTRFASNFFAAPRGGRIICKQGRALGASAIVNFSSIAS